MLSACFYPIYTLSFISPLCFLWFNYSIMFHEQIFFNLYFNFLLSIISKPQSSLYTSLYLSGKYSVFLHNHCITCYFFQSCSVIKFFHTICHNNKAICIPYVSLINFTFLYPSSVVVSTIIFLLL